MTNELFAEFVAATGYVTLAERPPNPDGLPRRATGESRAGFDGLPEARPVRSTCATTRTGGRGYRERAGDIPLALTAPLEHLARHPVVHVAYEDVEAYARWAGKDLATEAEWEFAARGGLDGATFTWGNEEFPDGKAMVNSWQGEFPWQNLLTDGHEGTSPVGSFPPNGYGLYDMAGNVWEWTSDWYEPRGSNPTVKSCCMGSVNPRVVSPEKSYNPHQPQFRIPRRVVKGGSHLCAPNYCFRYRPAARQPQMIDTGMGHIGFRCVVRTARVSEAAHSRG